MSLLPTAEQSDGVAPGTSPAQRWLAGELGRELLRAEAELLASALDDVFGLELLQLGGWGPARDLLSASRTRRQTIVLEQPDAPGADLVGRLTALPISAASVDAVLLPHTLEFAADPQAIVREADRVLTGEGQLIVLGFKPFSLWGLRAAAAASKGFPPGLRQMLPEHRVRDWLNLLGYETVMSRHYLYSRPWGGEGEGSRRILRRGLFNPLPAAAYLIKARKRIYTLTPIRARFTRERQPVLGGLVNPTTRSRS